MIAPWPENRFYWQYKGKPLLLLGGSNDDNLFQWPGDLLRPQLDQLRSVGGNYVRNTMSDRPDRGFEQYPFKRLDNGKYDLEAWNAEYWERFEQFLRWTHERDIIVQIEVWDRFDFSLTPWDSHPYNPKNNVNFTNEESGLAAEYPEHPGKNLQPFFFTTPKQRNNTVVLRHQQRFVDRMLSDTLRFGHVLYCIDNETSGEEEWGRYWAEYIKRRARERDRTVYVTEMWDDWDITAEEHRHTLDHPELYDFVDMSQNNHNSGVDHWRNALWVRQHLTPAPRPINTVKTYGADGNKFGHSDQDGLERFFRHILAGFAAARFHRPDSGLGLNTRARAAIRAARQLELLVPPWTMNPREGTLASEAGRDVYLAEAGDTLILYFPDGGRASVEMTLGEYQVSWVGLDASSPQMTVATESGRLSISAPTKSHWLAVVRKAPSEEP
ncbi:MAG: hypothetical protein GEU99_13470 [Luteitalea sp.]|nr:hypothetical protein [Luteitalea sp.]